MKLEEMIALIREQSEMFELEERAIKSCQQIIKQLANEKDDFGGYKSHELILKKDMQYLIFEWYLTEQPIIRTVIMMYVTDPDGIWLRGLQRIGYYHYECDLNGEVYNDSFVIEKSIWGESSEE
ncbi:hypothetical protein SAMN05421823_102142 [Catalinimonas alkaloidigena]|uniref:Uncharacterized protein n=1 Tax=Catalinimonas alkaloidigena TaxID=1075417 RepID=A0A1G9A1G4_9BACT|nr:hypothetical protein [Catalinimonas alkaloidigena]SDK20704.1 hypothetical protein SAMN05421823_102142 [Catalinimonas alkaloidigena]